MNENETSPPIPNSIHYTELEPAKIGEPFFHEWNTYLKELGRLLDEGYAGKYVLLKDETIVGIFDSVNAARAVGLKRYLLQPFLVQQIRSQEPSLRIRGYNMPCPVSTSLLAKPA